MNIISKLINFNLLGFIIPYMIQKRALDWLKNIRFLPYFVATVFNIPTDVEVLFFPLLSHVYQTKNLELVSD